MNAVEPDVPDNEVTEAVGDVIMDYMWMTDFLNDDNMEKYELNDDSY